MNTSDDLGAGQLGLEDSESRGQSEDTIGDNLEEVELGTGRTSGWIFAAFDHTCVIFSDAQAKWCVLRYIGSKVERAYIHVTGFGLRQLKTVQCALDEMQIMVLVYTSLSLA